MRRRWNAIAGLSLLLIAGGAAADAESCREWRREHCTWSARAISRYLGGAPQKEIDEAVFELLQREAYLTSCEAPVESSRRSLVGWRLVGRVPDDYGSVVVEALLDNAGFDIDLRDQLTIDATAVASNAPRGARFPPRWQWLQDGSR